jgi:hypothetical protein
MNVKDFGAVGDGVTNDAPAIQNAFNACFMNGGTPIPLFFPAGTYIVNTALTLTNVDGAWMFGGGSGEGGGKTIIAAPNGTGVIICNGVGDSIFENMQFLGTNGGSEVTFDLNGNPGGGVNSIGDVFRNCLFQNGGTGLRMQNAGAQVSEILIDDCTFSNCSVDGIALHNFNCLNIWVIGGGAISCGNAGYRAYRGSFPVLHGLSLAGNTWDIIHGGAIGISISGCRTESFQFVNLQNCQAVISGCFQQPSSASPTNLFVQTDHIQPVTIIGCGGFFSVVRGEGNLIDCQFGTDQWTSALSKWYFRNLQVGLNYDGTGNGSSVHYEDGIYIGNSVGGHSGNVSNNQGIIIGSGTLPITVAQLPTAGTAGRRAIVSDATATTFASIVAGTGGNTVPVYDNGTNWIIG